MRDCFTRRLTSEILAQMMPPALSIAPSHLARVGHQCRRRRQRQHTPEFFIAIESYVSFHAHAYVSPHYFISFLFHCFLLVMLASGTALMSFTHRRASAAISPLSAAIETSAPADFDVASAYTLAHASAITLTHRRRNTFNCALRALPSVVRQGRNTIGIRPRQIIASYHRRTPQAGLIITRAILHARYATLYIHAHDAHFQRCFSMMAVAVYLFVLISPPLDKNTLVHVLPTNRLLRCLPSRVTGFCRLTLFSVIVAREHQHNAHTLPVAW